MPTKSSILIRRAELADVPAVTDIYNQAILAERRTVAMGRACRAYERGVLPS